MKANIQMGDVFWVTLAAAGDEAPRIPHPHVVVSFDAQRAAVALCALTTNPKKISMPGNVLLHAGEANLPRQSIVEASKTVTVPASELGDFIGRLSAERVRQILSGARFVRASFLNRR